MTTTKTIRRTGAELIAFHFGADIAEVRDMIYQPTRYRSPNVYCWGEDYFCCPTATQGMPKHRDVDDGFKWEKVGEYYGRTVYRAKAGDE